jgi:hypothetical protein
MLDRFGFNLGDKTINLNDIKGRRAIFSVREKDGYTEIDKDSVIPE